MSRQRPVQLRMFKRAVGSYVKLTASLVDLINAFCYQK